MMEPFSKIIRQFRVQLSLDDWTQKFFEGNWTQYQRMELELERYFVLLKHGIISEENQ